jgi:hypothetical protein
MRGGTESRARRGAAGAACAGARRAAREAPPRARRRPCLTRAQFVWDVGHQAYGHKILTGRRDRMHTIRQTGGLSGAGPDLP